MAEIFACSRASSRAVAKRGSGLREAAALFAHLRESFPRSPYVGDGYVRQTDIALEAAFDVNEASKLSKEAVEWVKAQPKDQTQATQVPSEVWRADPLSIGSLKAPSATYEIYLRAGLLAYLAEDYDGAVRLFELAIPYAPPREFVVVDGRIPTGIECIREAALAKRAFTPKEALDGDVKVRLVLQLADIYLEATSYQKANDLASLVLEDLKRGASVPQCSWAHRQRAMALSSLRQKLDAKPEFIASQRISPDMPWAAECLFLAGTITHNHEKKPWEAIGLYEEVLRRYPKSEVASKAAYFVGVTYEWNARWTLARTAYERVIRDYPESRWARAAIEYHLKKVDAALDSAKDDQTDKTKEK